MQCEATDMPESQPESQPQADEDSAMATEEELASNAKNIGIEFGTGTDGLTKALQHVHNQHNKHMVVDEDVRMVNSEDEIQVNPKPKEKAVPTGMDIIADSDLEETNEAEWSKQTAAKGSKGKDKQTEKRNSKGKGKAKVPTSIEIIVDSDLEEDDEAEQPTLKATVAKKSKGKGKQTEKSTAEGSKKPKVKVLSVKRNDIQLVMEDIQCALKEATLGYALMTLLDHNDLGRGPKMVIQSINPRDIDMKYTRIFKKSVNEKGIQSKKVENAIVLGVEKEWLDMASLEGMHEGIYDNRVVWSKPHFDQSSECSVLFNGNHRYNYMKTEDPCRLVHHQYTTAVENVGKTTKKAEKEVHEAMIESTQKMIIERGVWLVRFIDLGMIRLSEDPSLLEHHLATNSPLTNLQDTEDVKLSQVLLMIASMPVQQRQLHINSLCAHLTPATSLYKILKDPGLYKPAMHLLAWSHFRGTTSGAGLTARHLLSWNPVYGGMMQKFARHMTDVLRFLSLPLKLNSMDAVNREATAKDKDPEALRRRYGRMLHKKMVDSTRDMECEGLDKHFLDEWMRLFVDLISSTNVFEKFGSSGQNDTAEYSKSMDVYWRRIRSHCAKLAKQPPKGIEAEMSMVIQFMEHKIEWLCAGLVFQDQPAFLSTLPLPNKFLLSDILKLYANDQLSLDKVIIDMVVSVEPMAKVVIEQRDVKPAKKGDQVHVRPWTNYTSALFHMMEHDDVAINELWSLLVDLRRSHLLLLARWAKPMLMGKLKPTERIQPKLVVPSATEIIKNYGKKVAHHRDVQRDISRPPPEPSSLKISDEAQAEYIADLRQMLYVSSLEWSEKGAVKKIETMVKHTWPISLAKSDRQLLLATKEGWELRKKLGDIVKKAGITDRATNTMIWWDGFNKQPTNVRLIDSVLIDNLGLLANGTMSSEISEDLSALCKTMMRHSEKHIAQLENPTMNVNKMVFDNACLVELRQEYIPGLPPVATAEEEVAHWNPIKMTEKEKMDPIIHLHLTTSTDRKIMKMDKKVEDARHKLANKVVEEKEKVILYDRKTQARRRAEQRNARIARLDEVSESSGSELNDSEDATDEKDAYIEKGEHHAPPMPHAILDTEGAIQQWDNLSTPTSNRREKENRPPVLSLLEKASQALHAMTCGH
ncbi:hypothetical protein JVU11DRAFT_11962 [Chiua virens]|nr:hypothetical protein JVU11DRAFT_11962 [Chiua virens]